MRSMYPNCSASATLDKDRPKRNVRRSDDPLRAMPKGMYKRILFRKSGPPNLLSIYLSEGCRSPTGIIVATTIRAIEGASRRRRRRGSENSFKGRLAQGAVYVGEKFSIWIYGDGSNVPTKARFETQRHGFLVVVIRYVTGRMSKYAAKVHFRIRRSYYGHWH
jgi:hypothetical protein